MSTVLEPSADTTMEELPPLQARQCRTWFHGHPAGRRLGAHVSNEPIRNFALLQTGRPIACAVFQERLDRRARVLGVAVDPQHRGQQHGARLLREASAHLTRDNSIREVLTEIESDNRRLPLSQRLLQAAGFAEGETTAEVYRGYVHTQTPDYWKDRTRLPVGFSCIAWRHLRPEQREKIRTETVPQWDVPYVLNPFRDMANQEPLNSLVLCRENQEVVGWMVTHRLGDDSIRYSSIYVIPPLQQYGLAMPLMAHSILLHAQYAPAWRTRWIFHVPTEMQAMWRVATRRFARHTNERAQVLTFRWDG
ncbi:MAG: hypothetical protein SynsKO_05340 [Synoicihabitans sp.]